MTEAYIPPTETLFGTDYARHQLVAMIEDRTDSERLTTMLREAGFDVTVYSGKDIVRHRTRRLQNGGLTELIEADEPEEEREIVNEYVRRAWRGEYLILVHLDSSADTDRVVAALLAHGGQRITRYEEDGFTTFDENGTAGYSYRRASMGLSRDARIAG